MPWKLSSAGRASVLQTEGRRFESRSFHSPIGRKTEKMITIKIPKQVNEILDTLHNSGYEAYIVGGCVRDAVLGRSPHDWDITTSAEPDEVKAIFTRTIDTGLKHGTVTVMYGKTGYEITTFRIDGDYRDGRHPDSVAFTKDLTKDLERRDFTINAMAYTKEGGLIDPFDGYSDIKKGVIRAVGDPMQRFSEDALRIMRALRFSAQLGYEIDPETLKAAEKLAPKLKRISAERIRSELEKILVSDRPDILRLAWKTGITKQFLPEFDSCMETRQNNPYHCFTVGEHILESMRFVKGDRVLRLTMLLHDIGKPECLTTDERGTDHFYGHVEKSCVMAEEILRRLKYDNDTIGKVLPLIEWHDKIFRMTEPAIRRGVSEIGKDMFPLLLEVKRADAMAQSAYKKEEKLETIAILGEAYKNIIRNGDCLTLKDLAVNGNDIMACGIKPGKEVGKILKKMMDDVINVPEHNNKDYLIRHHVRQRSREEAR